MRDFSNFCTVLQAGEAEVERDLRLRVNKQSREKPPVMSRQLSSDEAVTKRLSFPFPVFVRLVEDAKNKRR